MSKYYASGLTLPELLTDCVGEYVKAQSSFGHPHDPYPTCFARLYVSNLLQQTIKSMNSFAKVPPSWIPDPTAIAYT